MTDELVPNNPAGRLREVLEELRNLPGEGTPTEWWNAVAPGVSGTSDGLTVRAEAATLFREVEVAVRALPTEDDPETLLSKRDLWAEPIFGIGGIDQVSSRVAAGNFVSAEALYSLANIHSILRRESPEYRVKNDVDLINRTLDETRSQLLLLREEVNEIGEAISPIVRARLLRDLGRAIDDIDFVKLRGYGRLYQDLVISQVDIAAVSESPEVKEDSSALERLRNALQQIQQSVVLVEQIFLPGSAAVSYGVLSGDIVGAIALWFGARRAIGPVAKGSEPLALPSGEGTSGAAN